MLNAYQLFICLLQAISPVDLGQFPFTGVPAITVAFVAVLRLKRLQLVAVPFQWDRLVPLPVAPKDNLAKLQITRLILKAQPSSCFPQNGSIPSA
jgi:hypothetical protein